jgi:hypothetical protein
MVRAALAYTLAKSDSEDLACWGFRETMQRFSTHPLSEQTESNNIFNINALKRN